MSSQSLVKKISHEILGNSAKASINGSTDRRQFHHNTLLLDSHPLVLIP